MTNNDVISRMKLTALLIASASAFEDDQWIGPDAEPTGLGGRMGGDRALDPSGERRYEDLKKIAKIYWRKQNTGETFDEKDYWAYGCHCFMLGDRAMSEPGSGKP